LEALLQMPSTFAFKLEESVGSLWITDLHTATACATPAAVVGRLVGTLGVVAGADVDVVPLVAGVELVVPAALLVAGGELLWLLDVELLLLPQPAMNTPTSATTSHVDSCLIICPP
jgi:hypothetical protein